jgi:Raf kinase inhibitor-like YbhB/YbcL family protein
MQISSKVFAEGKAIPKEYTGDGKDASPPLQWTAAPAGTKSLALICDDPDAPRAEPWVHWVIYDLPGTALDLPEGVPTTGSLSSGAKQGRNDFGNTGYGGPAPPRGKPHRYFFKLFALDAMLNLKEGATKKQVEEAMKVHVLAEGQLMGTYQR